MLATARDGRSEFVIVCTTLGGHSLRCGGLETKCGNVAAPAAPTEPSPEQRDTSASIPEGPLPISLRLTDTMCGTTRREGPTLAGSSTNPSAQRRVGRLRADRGRRGSDSARIAEWVFS